ncbi:Aminoglycoside phosphotransferase [Penicillium malachiteum]|uniref:Aminoglycoside phosphotransferase n=1 Tax=Penicillium malachiteum TaxID=1324776 RepID=A0AAD6HVJ8_9EURO|nr:Aminoglycoside phosphotransferase [Penicillium malachiteum]
MTRRISPSELTDSKPLVPDNMIHVFRVDETTVVKLCNPTRLAEAEALKFIRSKTSLPVPEVCNTYIDESIDRGVIIMEYIEGDVLLDVINNIEYERRENIAVQLRAYMTEMRSFEGEFIGSVDGSACEDPVFCREQGGFGLYKTETYFNDGLIRAMNMNGTNSWITHVSRLVRAMPCHKIVLTHVDFSPRNIIVKGDRITSIIDWEMSGFYPEYWEYIKAMYHPDWQSVWINEGFPDRVLQSFHLEHAVMLHMQEVV